MKVRSDLYLPVHFGDGVNRQRTFRVSAVRKGNENASPIRLEPTDGTHIISEFFIHEAVLTSCPQSGIRRLTAPIPSV